MKDAVIIYYKDKDQEQDKIQSVVDLVGTILNVHVTRATVLMEHYGFIFPVINLGTRLYGYKDGVDAIKEIYLNK